MLDDSFHVYDTTLRDGAQGEGMSFSVGRQARGGPAARRARRRLRRGRLAGRAAEGHRVLRPRPHRAAAAARAAGRLRRDPQGRRAGRHRPAGARAARRADAGGLPGREVRPAARAPGAAHHPGGEPGHGRRHRRLPGRRGPPGLPRLRALLRRLRGTTGTTGCGCWRPRSPPAPTSACCATPTAACCRWASAGWSPRWSSGPASGSACTRRTTPACAVANTLAAVDAGATHVQGTANGYGERPGNADLFAVIGGPGAQDGPAGPARPAASAR